VAYYGGFMKKIILLAALLGLGFFAAKKLKAS
jgi:hypothetical protein